jgi:hypothetical protein
LRPPMDDVLNVRSASLPTSRMTMRSLGVPRIQGNAAQVRFPKVLVQMIKILTRGRHVEIDEAADLSFDGLSADLLRQVRCAPLARPAT